MTEVLAHARSWLTACDDTTADSHDSDADGPHLPFPIEITLPNLDIAKLTVGLA